ncbi:PREDICTED: signal recognition particle 9 kDa protein-like [Amphimedon queenslandica]|uniref:Signal recognition particle 9 kDa protein n=1 Tax=Amphimedon queenslandica TaxID=400682 RepID=A0A1X7UL80_AMPQE|nr:PREDICTED: signal recognition particle 9 kDa protein-like [Amphimedon queenslandica]|eukprot:XP_003387628.1 PREDICTED: signal recognition particle 9 kDa protein-like [Amphimedon queenslandica]
MPYLQTWDDFAKGLERLYQQNPWKVRFIVKYRHCSGSLVLKATDDNVCIKYRTDQLQDVKKLERLNNTLLRHMIAKVPT